MSDYANILNQLLEGLSELSTGLDSDKFPESFHQFVSNLPRGVTSPDTFYDENTETASLEERIAALEIREEQTRTLAFSSSKEEELVSGDNHVEPFEIEYGIFEDGPIDGNYDHIDVTPCDIDGNKNDLGQIAIATSSDGELMSLVLADNAVVKFLRLERPGETYSTSTIVYGQMLGPLNHSGHSSFLVNGDTNDDAPGVLDDKLKATTDAGITGVDYWIAKNVIDDDAGATFEYNVYLNHRVPNTTTFHTINTNTYHIFAVDQRGHIASVSSNSSDWLDITSAP